MENNIIDGKKTSEIVLNEIHNEVTKIINRGAVAPHLAAVLVGNDAASHTYVNAKVRACEKVGFHSTLIKKEESMTQNELENLVLQLNNDDNIDGFIVQVPLPKHLNAQRVIELIDPSKDVDGFHPFNMGKLALGLPALIPATPKGILLLLEKNNIETASKNVVVLGRSNTVGTPTSILLSRKKQNATVTLCHSATKNLTEHIKKADILIVALGIPHFLKKDMISPNAIIVDVGIHRVPCDTRKSGFRLVGDVDFENIAPLCKKITPVPGGVGPMTIAGLLHNTLLTYLQKKGK